MLHLNMGTRKKNGWNVFFSDYHIDELEEIFLKDGLFVLEESFETEDVRPDYKNKPWVNIIVRKK